MLKIGFLFTPRCFIRCNMLESVGARVPFILFSITLINLQVVDIYNLSIILHRERERESWGRDPRGHTSIGLLRFLSPLDWLLNQ